LKIVYFDCFSGISGDMILGAFVDAGLHLNHLKSELEKLRLKGYEISGKKVLRAGIAGTKVTIDTYSQKKHSQTNHHDSYLMLPDIQTIIEKSGLPQSIKQDSIKIFHKLAAVEAKVHNTTIEKVHFHEVGSIDSIIDIVGSVIAFHTSGIKKIYFSPIPTGSGYIRCDHGIFPVPAPATAELLKNQRLKSVHSEKELTTPTGAAIVTALGTGLKSIPEMKIHQVGYGAGSNNNPEIPNLLRIFIGEEITNGKTEGMWVVETNIDNMPGEIFGYVMEKLFHAGAVDAYFTPIQMKKGRPGITISAIANEQYVPSLESVLFDQTTTFGVRKYKVFRTILEREERSHETSLGKVRVKTGSLHGEIKSISPEYEDCRRIAEQKGMPLKQVYMVITEELNKQRIP